MRLFDVYLAVDWSARSAPSPAAPTRDALWVGERFAPNQAAETSCSEIYWRTRHACIDYLRTRLLQHMGAGRRVLLGFDFPLGYPAGYSAALGLSGDSPPWRKLWEELQRLMVDDATNANNRFQVAAALNARCDGPVPGPLWGCPSGMRLSALAPTSPSYPYPVRAGLSLDRLRLTEYKTRGIQPTWKLYGVGSVGGQALVGIPAISRLRSDPALESVSHIWPLETGFTPAPTSDRGPAIIFAEIWPGLVPDPLDPHIAIRDQAQVRAAVRWLAHLDTTNQLGVLFAKPAYLSSEALARCVTEEGWILGSGLSVG
ncbi:MAG TPA: hypothetical protein VH599_04225 [Ktedonobacterales bacterium]|jgi:hypothetical protein